jgi:predicted nuclease of predicted toxin-antitoxin system
MRLLLDESLPTKLAGLIVGHEVSTVRQMDWLGVKNGELLARAAGAGFEAFLTADRGFAFQQNLVGLPFSVVLMAGRSNRIQDLEPLIPRLLETLSSVPGTFARVGP